jgi:hypothetical protein
MSQSIKRAFSYNVGSPIAGTSQVGNIAIQAASQDYSQDPGGVKWWSGPIEDSGYVITYPVPTGDHPTPGGQVTAFIGFKRSAAKTEGSFIDLANRISGQNFPNGNDAKDWLNTNGYWCSWQTAVGLSVKLGTNTAGICGQNDMTVYTTSGVITPGLTLYFDSGMTTPVTTFTYVQDYYNTTITYHLNSTTGLIGSNSGQSC